MAAGGYEIDALIKAAVTRRHIKRAAIIAGGLALLGGASAGGAAWALKHPRSPKGQFRRTPDKPTAPHATPLARTANPATPAAGLPPAAKPVKATPEPASATTTTQAGAPTPRLARTRPTLTRHEFAKLYPHVKFDIRPDPQQRFGSKNTHDVRTAFHQFAQIHPDTAARVTRIGFSDPDAEIGKSRFFGTAIARMKSDGDVEFHVLLNPRIGQANRYTQIDQRRGDIAPTVSMVTHPHASKVQAAMFHELGHCLHMHAKVADIPTGGLIIPTELYRATRTDRVLLPAYRTQITLQNLRNRALVIPAEHRTADRSAPFRNFTVSDYSQDDTAEFFAENYTAKMMQRSGYHPGFPKPHDDLDSWVTSFDEAARRHAARIVSSVKKWDFDRQVEQVGLLVLCRPYVDRRTGLPVV